VHFCWLVRTWIGDVQNILVELGAYFISKKKELGTYFQVQDDYPDCFGDPEFIGKISTCSFFVTNLILVLLCSSLRPMLYFFNL